MTEELKLAHYFVDEAGDTTLFNRRGKVIVGDEGVSHLFMVGVAHLPQPEQADETLSRLRKVLLADPFFKGVPSMQPAQKKTALCFHAKNDLPEVRREVFKLLPGFKATIQVAIMRKRELAASVKRLNAFGGYKYYPDAIYDDLVRHAFKNLLQGVAETQICFARRGKSTREQSLRLALAKARADLAPWLTDCMPRPWHRLPGERNLLKTNTAFRQMTRQLSLPIHMKQRVYR